MQNLNKHNPGHWRRMAHHKRIWNLLFNGFLRVAEAIIQKGGHLLIEWPNECRYWKEPKVLALLGLQLHLYNLCVRACAHGQDIEHGPERGKYPTKVWRLLTTIPGLAELLQLPCPGDHEHGQTYGAQTAASAKYPPKMAERFYYRFQGSRNSSTRRTRQSQFQPVFNPYLGRMVQLTRCRLDQAKCFKLTQHSSLS